jgi:precorrin-2 dehydrogenase/sirohydrochlorin ferrochelatase
LKEAAVLPLVLDVEDRRVVVAGRGLAVQQRYEYARDARAGQIALFVIDQDGWACHAEAALYERLPVKADLQGAAIVLVAGLPPDDSARIAGDARAAGAFVNVEDQNTLSDFHVPAVVRRGDLVLTASTGGRAPGLSRRIGAYLQTLFANDWAQHTSKIAEARAGWRDEGRAKSDVARLTDALIDREGWLRQREDA